ncbi:zinc-binding dehydrogenase [Pseudomonas syringae]|uniref:zinc-binding dehydrogenase n=1 Tax=Pseudomonas syringae TaxID=317 RepID=UPI00315A0B89
MTRSWTSRVSLAPTSRSITARTRTGRLKSWRSVITPVPTSLSRQEGRTPWDNRSRRLASPGRIAVIGVTPGQHSPIPDYLSLILKNVTIRGIANGSREMFVDLIRAIEANGVETVVARTFKFADAPEAYAYFAAARHIGKVLIEFEQG